MSTPKLRLVEETWIEGIANSIRSKIDSDQGIAYKNFSSTIDTIESTDTTDYFVKNGVATVNKTNPKTVKTLDLTNATFRSLTSAVMSAYMDLFPETNEITTISLPETCTTIGTSSFEHYGNLVTINGEVTELQSSAFYRCTNLKNINLPIVKGAGGCFKGLTSLTLPFLEEIEYTFYDTEPFAGAESVDFPELTTWIPGSSKAVAIAGSAYNGVNYANLPKLSSIISDRDLTANTIVYYGYSGGTFNLQSLSKFWSDCIKFEGGNDPYGTLDLDISGAVEITSSNGSQNGLFEWYPYSGEVKLKMDSVELFDSCFGAYSFRKLEFPSIIKFTNDSRNLQTFQMSARDFNKCGITSAIIDLGENLSEICPFIFLSVAPEYSSGPIPSLTTSLICRAVEPPVFTGSEGSGGLMSSYVASGATLDFTIYVPDDSVIAYSNDAEWGKYTIKGISEFSE